MKKFILSLLFFIPLSLSKLDAYELAIATMFNNVAPYLKEWIEYHKAVGVDHFWLYNDKSEDNWEEVLQPYIDEGTVEVFYWPKAGLTWFREQRLAIKDGIKRAQQTNTKWIALIDQDEFLLPLDDSKSIPECLNKHFQTASAIYINWRNFGTGNVFLAPDDWMIFNLTSCSLITHSRNGVGKSIVRPECVIVDKINYVHHFPLVEGSTYLNGDAELFPMVDGRVKVSGKHFKYIRINHYSFRDEKYFTEVRLPRAIEIGHQKHADAHDAFNLDKDYAIIEFIQKKHPELYEKYGDKR